MSAVPVTHHDKRYIFVCAGCGYLSESSRSDALTCSVACRVSAHRSGNLKRIRNIADSFDIAPARLLQAKAIKAVRPDLAMETLAGRLTIDDAQPQMRRTFDEMLLREAQA